MGIHWLILIKCKGNNNNNTKPTNDGKQEVDDRLREVQDRKKVRPTHYTIAWLSEWETKERHSTN